ncbi:glyceraldehyde-3-phosphate dehydrogenase [Flavobacterium sp. N3904]|uniref:glyceraldehyde-3-phosphate dehydrogenase n=1 Tax=Flavobacterium sp. N3904 TaxID=2986835 RepID=UPI00222592D6|nr:glyceraldehyde-3-phosphate dehydrogenase [Flavobacterium sp. N3904]
MGYTSTLKSVYFKFYLIFSFLLSSFICSAQVTKESKWEMLKDTLDGKLDLSNYIIKAHGFVPIPILITQPALGGFGGAIAPVFITPKKRPEGYKGYIPPDITGGFAMYTANKSWGTDLFRMGSFPSLGLKYKIATGYNNINIDYYHQFEVVGEEKLEFNIKAVPIFLSVSKKINKENVYLGMQYLYSKNILKPDFKEDLPDYITAKDLNSKVGSLGMFLDYDTRNTIFTPDKGYKVNLLFSVDDNWTGSDYKYERLHGYINWFIPIKSNWISGLHFDAQQAFGETPFYLLPDIDMQGIPTARYQGETTLVLETEQRFDLSFRWSIVGFGGIGKAISKTQNFNSGTTVYNYGTGFRYYLARAFGLRTGIDIAKGPDSWGYYVVFGQSWNR